MNRLETKVPYIPSQEKRFEVSSDNVSRERVAAIKETYKILKDEVPFFAGVTVYGSLSKGKILDDLSNNDIDMVVFLDKDKYDQTIDKFAEETKGFVLIPMVGGINVTKEELRESGLKRGAEVYAVQRARELINNKLNNKACFHEKVTLEDVAFISTNGYNSIFLKVESHDEDYQMLKGYGPEESLFFGYAAPFFLDVGGGLKKYRESFIKSLNEQPLKKAEHLWNIVYKSMIYWERKNEISGKIATLYPKTFVKAKKCYG